MNKAETLAFIKGQLPQVNVLPVLSICADNWSHHQSCIAEIKATLGEQSLIVRSSADDEDTDTCSNAGAYVSVLNVSTEDEIKSAIDQVFSSYTSVDQDAQVLIQPYLDNVSASGVLFTREPSNASYYYILNYDDSSGRTDSVTAGDSDELKTLYWSHNSPVQNQSVPWLGQLMTFTRELESLFEKIPLDIEFGVSKENQVYIFQCRPLVLKTSHLLDETQQTKRLLQIEQKIRRLSEPHPYLLGEKSVFGVMPDWNPAEIIGIRPKPLALSLYKELITDSIWAYQRDNYGYRNLRSFPLLTSFAGQPYIDVRVSFNSFIPETLSESVAEKLVNFYIESLRRRPELHDKVEFEIIFSCLALDTETRIQSLLDSGFSPNEIGQITNCLRKLTNDILGTRSTLVQQDLEKIRTLEKRQVAIQNSNLNKVEQIYWLMEDCKRYGTLPFAGLARAGFIAMQLLNSLVSLGIFNKNDEERFLSSLNTVSGELLKELSQLNAEEFIAKYGHLRPGTYDITSPRYDEAPEQYFDLKSAPQFIEQHIEEFTLSPEKVKKIELALENSGLDITVRGLFSFMKTAIEGREWAKFVFSKSLSDCLSMLETFGNQLGFSRSSMAYSDIKDILKLYSSSFGATATIESSIKFGRESFKSTQALQLPGFISEPQDIYCFEVPQAQPNYVTQLSTTAECAEYDADSLTGKIVFIEAADPGFDWVFSHNIAGLITKYGGVNSHMAIRAGELSIPAVIGAGEKLFKYWNRANKLHLDCQNHKVEIIS